MSNLVPQGWMPAQLDDLLSKIEGGGTPSRDNELFWDGDIPWATVKDLKGVMLRSTQESISADGLKGSSCKLIPANTIIIACRMAVGKAVIFDRDVAINQDLKALHPKSNTDWRYLIQWYLSKSDYISSLGTGSTVKGIRLDDLKILPINLPPLPEQQKIAQILTSVDDVIEKTQAQIDKLKDLKIAMMQELLTNGIGHLEFKDSPVGRIPVGWGLTTLGEIGKWKGGGTPSKANKNYWCGQIPWVSPKDMKVEYISKTQDSISMEAILGSSTNLVEKGSLLIVVRSGILQHTLPVAIANCDLTINQDMKALTLSSGFCALYVYHYLLANNHNVLRATLKAGNTVESIDFAAFSIYQIPSPPLIEQVEIANAVESVANNIRKKELTLISNKNTKKALMQDLLTGKVRVNINNN
jgi:type I restriction enzyme S subunit